MVTCTRGSKRGCPMQDGKIDNNKNKVFRQTKDLPKPNKLRALTTRLTQILRRLNKFQFGISIKKSST